MKVRFGTALAIGVLASVFAVAAAAQVTSYPYQQDFDTWGTDTFEPVPLSDGWTNDGTDGSRDWRIGTGSTPSTNGPPSGHGGSGNYLYYEDSNSHNTSGEVRMTTPQFDLTGVNLPEFSFWVHSYFNTTYGAHPLHIDLINITTATTITDVMPPIVGTTNNWTHFSFDLSPYVGDTIQIQFRLEESVSSFYNDVSIDSVELLAIPDGAYIEGTAFDGQARVGGTDLPVSSFNVYAFGPIAQDFNGLTLTYTGSVDPAEIGNIKLWDDTNDNGVVDTGESQLGSTVASLTSGTAVFTGSPVLNVPGNSSVNLLVTCDIGSGASGKETVSFEINSASDVIASPGPDQSFYPVTGGAAETVLFVDSLPFFTDFDGGVEAGNQSLEFEAGTYPTATGVGAVPGSGTTSSSGSMNFIGSHPDVSPTGGAMLEMQYASSSAATALDSRFDLSGFSAVGNDVYLTFGWYDDGLVAPVGDDYNYVFLSDDGGQTWFTAAYDFDEDADAQNWTTAQVNLSDAFLNGGRTFTSDVIVRIQTGGTSTAQATLIDYVEVREIYEGVDVHTDVATNTAFPDTPGYGEYHVALEDDLKVLVFSLVPQLADQTVSEITVTNAGTMPDADITEVKLWLDVDYDGEVTTGDQQLGGTQVFSGGDATFSFQPLPVNLGTTRDFIVTYSFAPGASGDIGCEISGPGSIVVTPGQAYAYETFPTGGVMGTAASPTATLPFLEDFDSPPNFNVANRGKAGEYPTASEVGGAVTMANTANDVELGWFGGRNGITPNNGSVGMGTYEFLNGQGAGALDCLFDLSAFTAASDDLVFSLSWVNNGLDTASANFNHVFVSNDGGETWITSIMALDPSSPEDVWLDAHASVSAALVNAGEDFTSDMVIRVQFASDSQFAMVDDMELVVSGPEAPTIDDPEATGGGTAAVGFPELLYYKFNEGTGTTTLNEAVPGVGSQNATFSGSPNWITSDPVHGNSALQTGTGSTGIGYVESGWAPVLGANDSFTVEAWIRTGTTFQYLCGDSSASSWRFYFLGSTGNISLRSGGFSIHDTNSGGLNNNQWHHIALVYDSAVNETRWYLDGVHDSTMTGQSANINGSQFRVGSYSGSNQWDGDVDEFRFWAQAKSQQDIQAGMQAELQNYPSLQIQGSNPNYTATIEQGGNLDFSVTADDINTGDTLTFTTTVTGGTMSAAEAGFDQEFIGGVYNDPTPGLPAPRTLELTGVADTLGNIVLEIAAEDGFGLVTTITIDISIIPGSPIIRTVPQELPSMNAFGFGIPSQAEKFTVQGYGLTGNLTITAPSQFEVSQTATVGFSSSLSLTPVNGSVPRSDIYVRYAPSVSGPHEGDVIASGPGVDIDGKVAVDGYILPDVPPSLARPVAAADGMDLLTGEPETAGTGSGYPINTVWHDLRLESVYLASELYAAGLNGGAPITEIQYRVAEDPGQNLENVRIRMQHSGSDTVTDYSTSGFTTVYGPENHAADEFAVGQWFAFKFDTPFIWNGVDNVVVDFSMDGNSFTAGGGIFMRDVGPDRSRTGYDDSGSSYPFNNIANQTQLSEVPSIRMSQGLMVGGTHPNYTAVGVVGDPLDLEFHATDPNTQQVLTFTVTEVGGTLTAAQAGFNQTFSGGVYSDPNPSLSPHMLSLDGTAATSGTLDLEVAVASGVFNTVINLAIEIVAPPSLTTTGLPMPSFRSPIGGGASPELSFTVAGGDLLSDVAITVPDDFGISETSGSGYGSSVTLSPTGGSLAETTLYVIYDPVSGNESAVGHMVISTDRLTSIQTILAGAVGEDPVISTLDTPVPTLFAPSIGTPGDPESFTVIVVDPVGPVIVSAPDEFELSLSEGSGYGSEVAVAPPAGQSPLTIVVFVRYSPLGPASTASGNLEVAASSATPLDIAVEGVVGEPSDQTSGGDGDSSDSGCSTGTSDYSKWALLLGALAMLMLAARIRSARE